MDWDLHLLFSAFLSHVVKILEDRGLLSMSSFSALGVDLIGPPYHVPAVEVVVVVETWRLGPLEKGFPSMRYHAARVGGKNRERWGWFAK